VWRLVVEQTASLEEIERSWNYVDVMKANAVLDMRRDYERAYRAASEKGSK